jgi:hypothetical protein
MPWDIFTSEYTCQSCNKKSTPPRFYALVVFLIASTITYGAKVLVLSLGYSVPWYATIVTVLAIMYAVERVFLKLVVCNEI